MFSRNRSTPDPTPQDVHASPAGKGRPTPTRKESEAARRKPLVPADRKAAARAERSASKEARDREFQAMQTGDERFLPARDKGPVRRWVRDYVDARHNLGEYFLPFAVVMVMAMFFTGKSVVLSLVVIVLLYGVVLAVVVDAFLMSRKLRKRLAEKFGAAAVPKGTQMYGVMRAFQMRRMRLPRPQVERGAYPS